MQTEETDRLSREPESKRRRISTENEDGPTYTRTSKSRSGSPSCQIVDKPPVFVPMHIVIEDSDDEVAKHTPPRSRKEKDRLRPVTKSPARPRQAIIILSDDEDTPAIQAQQTRVASPEVDVLEPSDDDGPDPVMTIFIVPEMPNTEPLLVHRRYKQKLKDVRKAWCRHNNLRPSQEAECIFVWNNKRIYDVQSCQDIGILVEDDGAPYVLTADGLHESLENIALAATTRAIWEEEKLESQKRARAAEIELEGRSPEPTKEPEYKVILKSKNHNDVKLKMKRVGSERHNQTICNLVLANALQETTMQKLVDIFRSRNEVPVESQISVVYDGEELEPDLQVKDAEFMEDYEEGEVLNLEIHIK